MKTIKEQIEDLEVTRAAKVASMESTVAKSVDAGETMDAADAELFDTLKSEVKSIDEDLSRLNDLLKINETKAKAVEAKNANQGSESRNFAVAKRHENLEPGILFARHAMAVFAGHGNLRDSAEIAKRHYGEDSPVTRSLAFANGRPMEDIVKAAVAAGTTLDSTYAAPLLAYNDYAGDFVNFLRPQTIIGQFGVGNIPSLRRIPFNVHIKGQTSGGTGYWVGEGLPKPVTAFGYSNVYHGWYKVAAIAVLTDELIRFSNPSAEILVRDSLADVLVWRMDADFINPSFAGTANVSPASITNGITPVHSTGTTTSGTTADGIRADINKLWAVADAANNPMGNPVYITSKSIARVLTGFRNALGQPEFPGMSANGGSIDGVPVIASNYVVPVTAGGYFILVNASDIYLSDDGQATVDFSNQASIQMLDNPTNASKDGTPTTMVSMFQNDSTALRAHRFINYSRRRATAVAVLDQVSWSL